MFPSDRVAFHPWAVRDASLCSRGGGGCNLASYRTRYAHTFIACGQARGLWFQARAAALHRALARTRVGVFGAAEWTAASS